MQLSACGRSTLALYKDLLQSAEWDRQKHARLEVLTLAQAIDAALAGHIHLLLEILTRRLAAVHTAVNTQNWDLGRAWEMPSQRTSFVPEAHLIRAIKASARNKAVERGSNSSGSYGYGGSSSSRTKKSPTGGSRGGSSGTSQGKGRRSEGNSSSSASGASSSKKKSGSQKK